MQGYKNTKQAAEYLGISVRTLHKFTELYNIPFYKPSATIKLFKVSDLDKWLEQFKKQAA